MRFTLQLIRKSLRSPFVAVGLLLPFLLGASHAENPSLAVAKPKLETKRHWYQIGRASWYGGKFQGRRTANGEVYDMNSLTAAHRTLPMGSWVRVTNLHNKKSVVVKINDRGPVPEDRVLDLSYAAAKALGFSGTASVRVELLDHSTADMMAQLQAPILSVAVR
jgi:rare lipoprotein A